MTPLPTRSGVFVCAGIKKWPHPLPVKGTGGAVFENSRRAKQWGEPCCYAGSATGLGPGLSPALPVYGIATLLVILLQRKLLVVLFASVVACVPGRPVGVCLLGRRNQYRHPQTHTPTVRP